MLRAKSEAPTAVRTFIASFTALLNRNRRDGGASRVVGTYQSDNASEFLSSDFASFLAANGVNATTCPPPCASIEWGGGAGHSQYYGACPCCDGVECCSERVLGLRGASRRRHSQPHDRTAELIRLFLRIAHG
eukprot:6213078-Pleurochrysis_carterae.AAC.1